MKTAGLIIGILFFLLSGAVGILGARKSFDAASTISKLTEGASDAEIDAMSAAGMPSAGRLKFGGIVGALGALAAVLGIVVAFVRRSISVHVGLATVLLCLVAVIVYPAMKTGPADGMAPRTQAIVALVMALIAAMGVYLREKKAAD